MECAGRIQPEGTVEVEVEEGDTTAEAEEEGASTEEGADAGLTGAVVEAACDGDRGGRLAINDGDRRRGGAVDERDGLKRLMGEGQVARGSSLIEGDSGLTLVGSRTTRESTRGRQGRSRVAGDGVGRLALAAAPEVTAPGDKEACQHDGENGGEARAETGPVEVDQGKAIVGLIQRHFAGFI